MRTTSENKKRPRRLRKKHFITVTAIAALFIFGVMHCPFGMGRKMESEMLVLGHAGSGFMSPLNPFNPLPANSMASIVKAIEKNGADGVEVDVQLSKDGVPILYHDVDLSSMTEKSGHVEQHPASEVVGLKYKGGFFYDLFHDEEIITLEAMLQRFATYQELPVLHLDLRNYTLNRHSYYAQTVLDLLQKYKYPFSKLMFISADPMLLESFRALNPQAPLMLDVDGDFETALNQALQHRFTGICADGKKISFEQVQKAKKQGLQVVLFGGKSRSTLVKLIELQPDAIQVNNVATLVDLLK